MTEKQQDAMRRLEDANGHGVVLHVGVGSSLVKLGKATKLATTGHGKLMAEYRAV